MSSEEIAVVKFMTRCVSATQDQEVYTDPVRIVIEEEVANINSNVFLIFPNALSIEVDKDNMKFASFEGNLYSKDLKTLVRYAAGNPSNILNVPNFVEVIGPEAVSHSQNLTDVILPFTVKTIDDEAFMDCKKLERFALGSKNIREHDYLQHSENWSAVVMGDVKCGNDIFCGCTSMKKIAFYNSVSLLTRGDVLSKGRAFSYVGTRGVPLELEIGGRANMIGDGTFSEFENLTDVNIGHCVAYIGNAAFYKCGELQNIVIGDETKPPINITIKSEAFINLEKLKSITINNNTSGVSCVSPFRQNVHSNYNISITFGDNVTHIGESLFRGMSNVVSITLGSNISYISADTFTGCNNVSDIYYRNTISKWFNVSIGKDSQTSMCLCDNRLFLDDSGEFYVLKHLVIPDEVKDINNDLFFGCSSLESVTIPGHVEIVREYAFASCCNLECVTIEKNDQGSTIELCSGAFLFCDSMTNIYLDRSAEVTSVWDDIYAGRCSEAPFSNTCRFQTKTKITIGDNSRYIDDYLFYDMLTIDEVIIGENIKEISSCVFESLENLTVYIPKSVERVADDAFSTTNVYYEGDKEMWDEILYETDNYSVDMQVKFNCTKEMYDTIRKV